MTSRLVALSFDAADPLAQARFWAAALRWDVGSATERDVTLVPTDGTRCTLRFRRASGVKRGKNPVHLDLTTASVDDHAATVRDLIERGGSHVDIGQRVGEPHAVLADPEGNELCVIEPQNSFLATCGRLGSITCDGSPRAGYFWSEALGWPLVWDQDEETAIRAPDGSGPFVTWGPPVPPHDQPNRLRLELAPDGGDQAAEVDRLTSLGASRVDEDATGPIVMADPDGTEFRLLP